MASVLGGLLDRRTFSLRGRSSWFALLIRQSLRHRTLRTSSYALIRRTWHATFYPRSRRTEFLRVFKSFRRRVSLRVSIQLLPHVLIPRCRCLHNPHTHFPGFPSLHTFQQPPLPYFPVPSSHLSTHGGNAYSRLADSIQAQQSQIPSRQGQPLSNQTVSHGFGCFPHVLPPTHEGLASHSAVPVPPSGRTFTDDQIMALITKIASILLPIPCLLPVFPKLFKWGDRYIIPQRVSLPHTPAKLQLFLLFLPFTMIHTIPL
jgi:hypothetical protein